MEYYTFFLMSLGEEEWDNPSSEGNEGGESTIPGQ